MSVASVPVGATTNSAVDPGTLRTATRGEQQPADVAFVVRMLEQGVLQLSLARFVGEHATNGNIEHLASQEAQFWSCVIHRLNLLADDLKIPMIDKPEYRVPDDFAHLEGSALDERYRETVSHANRAMLRRIERMDITSSPRVLFFVDDMWPQILKMQRQLSERS